MPAKLRWGILGTAEIARKNWKAIYHTGNSVVTAVASRATDRSPRFIAECQLEAPMPSVPAPFSTYEEMLASKNVDAVYIPAPTGVRKEWVIRAATAGKHVVCEKPCAVTVADLQEMLGVCARNKIQFMDGVMFIHSRRFARLRQVLSDAGNIGDLKRITSAFSFRADPDFYDRNIRGNSRLEPDGCLGDLGWYNIRLALWAMNWKMPTEVSGRILEEVQGPHGGAPVISEFSAELIFPGGVSSTLYCSFVAENQQWANISGTRGYIQMIDFVLPIAGSETSFELHKLDYKVKGCNFAMDAEIRRTTVPEPSHGHPDAQESNLFRNFADQVLSGTLNEEWPEQALKTQIVMGDCLETARALRGGVQAS